MHRRGSDGIASSSARKLPEKEFQRGGNAVMANQEQFTDSRRREDEFFYKRDQELILAARRHAESEAQFRELSAVTGISDQQILQDLQRFDYNPQTALLLELMPLVQVAWSDGSINELERERIFTIARLEGIETGDSRWDRLAQSLETRPSDEFFQATLRGLRASLEGMPVEDRRRRDRKLIMRCTSVGSVSGGFLGFGPRISNAEQAAINEIVAALRPSMRRLEQWWDLVASKCRVLLRKNKP
jgi:hypothetical protein